MPLMVGLIMVLFQFGILFISYLGLVHMGRDLERWLTVHPDSSDTTVMLYVTKDMPNTVMFPTEADGVCADANDSTINCASGTATLHCTYNSSTQAWGCAAGSANTSNPPAVPNGAFVVRMTPSCGAASPPCTVRSAYSPQRVTLYYDASSRMFLPTTFKLGFLSVPMPGVVQTYQFSMMVEPH